MGTVGKERGTAMTELIATANRLLFDTRHPDKMAVRAFAVLMTVITIVMVIRVLR
jgi:hypothetical protein